MRPPDNHLLLNKCITKLFTETVLIDDVQLFDSESASFIDKRTGRNIQHAIPQYSQGEALSREMTE